MEAAGKKDDPVKVAEAPKVPQPVSHDIASDPEEDDLSDLDGMTQFSFLLAHRISPPFQMSSTSSPQSQTPSPPRPPPHLPVPAGPMQQPQRWTLQKRLLRTPRNSKRSYRSKWKLCSGRKVSRRSFRNL